MTTSPTRAVLFDFGGTLCTYTGVAERIQENAVLLADMVPDAAIEEALNALRQGMTDAMATFERRPSICTWTSCGMLSAAPVVISNTPWPMPKSSSSSSASRPRSHRWSRDRECGGRLRRSGAVACIWRRLQLRPTSVRLNGGGTRRGRSLPQPAL